MTRRKINLALQGGGAHGAFTWGALDRLLDEDQVDIEGISATSAGAMNAAALKHGWMTGGSDGAKKSLADFWLRLAGLDASIPDPVMDWLRVVSPAPDVIARALEFNPAVIASDAMTRVLSPYQFNPVNYHPLRSIVDDLLDFENVCAVEGPKLFVTATHVKSGKPRVFSGDGITTDAILASACLPTLYQAIQIEDPKTGEMESYWDGGYMGNPALFPLFYNTESPDILIVHINPLERDDLPHTSTEILNRINEISFNASLLRELRAIDLVNRLTEQGIIEKGRMKHHFIHSVRDDAFMSQLGIATKITPNKALLLQLHDAGHMAMDTFLREHWKDLGQRNSVDLRAMFS
ncbi:patatin-like phospholipase family protein [Amaricoccus tamworthensis]|uniref:patatin-like phospholipase family protein n=1 Tax=Amaricoccus tamworthensis TaxID=57002 RepID=UPI003C7C61A6